MIHVSLWLLVPCVASRPICWGKCQNGEGCATSESMWRLTSGIRHYHISAFGYTRISRSLEKVNIVVYIWTLANCTTGGARPFPLVASEHARTTNTHCATGRQSQTLNPNPTLHPINNGNHIQDPNISSAALQECVQGAIDLVSSTGKTYEYTYVGQAIHRSLRSRGVVGMLFE